MKIAFDVDVLAKQMSINDYVHKVADWGYKYIEQSPHPRINPFYKHPLFSKECQAEYKQALKETGVEISSFIVVYRWSGPTEEQRQHAVANWKRIIEIAVDMGVPVINTEFSGDPNQQEICNGMFYKSMEEHCQSSSARVCASSCSPIRMTSSSSTTRPATSSSPSAPRIWAMCTLPPTASSTTRARATCATCSNTRVRT